jgi:hypothetical protein
MGRLWAVFVFRRGVLRADLFGLGGPKIGIQGEG